MFPEVKHREAESPEESVLSSIATTIRGDLPAPPVRIVSRKSEVAWTTVPKAAVYEDRHTWECDEVGRARQVAGLSGEPDALCTKDSPNTDLSGSMATPNRPHASSSLRAGRQRLTRSHDAVWASSNR